VNDSGNDPSCPPTFDTAAGHCTIGLTCSYPTGHCSCLGYCGGAAPPPDTDFSHWDCVLKRTDGCPDAPPTVGTPCEPRASSCSYGDCCIQHFQCPASQKWTSGPVLCPP
jgi:hypothetical protein